MRLVILPSHYIFYFLSINAQGRLQDGGLKNPCKTETNLPASCCSANEVCNFLYLQHKKNKVTRNCSPQILKRPNFWSMALLASHFSTQEELSLVFRNLQTSTLEKSGCLKPLNRRSKGIQHHQSGFSIFPVKPIPNQKGEKTAARLRRDLNRNSCTGIDWALQ